MKFIPDFKKGLTLFFNRRNVRLLRLQNQGDLLTVKVNGQSDSPGGDLACLRLLQKNFGG